MSYPRAVMNLNLLSLPAVPVVTVALLLAACGDDSADIPATFDGAKLTVMTRNLYLGGDLAPVITVGGIDKIPEAVAALWKSVLASDPRGRMKAVAAEIADANPDVVGLQEVEIYAKQEPGDFTLAKPEPNATAIEFDFLKDILDELVARGLRYQAFENRLSDVEMPCDAEGGQRFDLRVTDRDVILVREGLVATNHRPKIFDNYLTVPLGALGPTGPIPGATGIPVKLQRGFGTVEVTVDGARFVFGNSHLEVGGLLASFQEGQANEVVKLVDGIRDNLVLVGDFNSAANGKSTRSYGWLAAKMGDAWAKVNPGQVGQTCCTDLGAPAFKGTERIDIVFMKNGVRAESALVVGADPDKRTVGSLFPSDHAGVVAKLVVKR